VVVVDASFALEVLLETPRGLRYAGLFFDQERHAPDLIDLEIAQTLRRLVLAGELADHRAMAVLDIHSDLALVRHSHAALLSRIWDLRSSLSAYDAAYVTLAEALDMPLLTCDAKLARAHGHGAKIKLLT